MGEKILNVTRSTKVWEKVNKIIAPRTSFAHEKLKFVTSAEADKGLTEKQKLKSIL